MFKGIKKYRFLIINILLFTFWNCNHSKEGRQKYYYIIEHPDLNPKAQIFIENGDTSYLPPPPPPIPPNFPFYGDRNFILIDENRIFYHQRHLAWSWCGTGRDYTKAERLNLIPSDITEIKLSDLSEFLKRTIKSDTVEFGKKAFIKIASPKDTIYNPGINTILNHIKSLGIRRYLVRNSTEEENCVINSIIEKKPFDPKNCKFNEGFGGIKFTPPLQLYTNWY